MNLVDEEPFSKTKIGPDLFGGDFKDLHAADVKMKKEQLEEIKLQKVHQKARQDKNQFFRRKDGDGPSKGRGGSQNRPSQPASGRQGDGRKDPPKDN